MTVIVGSVSRAGAVMASDSQSSEEDATTNQVEKVWTSGGLLLGYSGQLAIREPLRRDIERRLQESPLPPQVPIEIAASMLCAIVRPVLEQAYANFVGAPGDDPAEKLAGSLMVIGYDGEQYWLLEIDRHNTPSHYTEEGFHTIGTGSVAAHVSRGLLKYYSLSGHEVKQFRLLAYRTVETCIDVLGGAYGRSAAGSALAIDVGRLREGDRPGAVVSERGGPAVDRHRAGVARPGLRARGRSGAGGIPS
jgi:hypothetical protein